MTNITDQTNDPGLATLQLLIPRFPHLAEMSKTAELDPSEYSDLPNGAFAWPDQRRFPIHNREHTALSVAYRKCASVVPAYVDDALTKAASIYGVDMALFEAPVVTEKVAAPATYLLEEKKRFRVQTPEDVKLAEEALIHRYKEMTIEDRTEAMYNLSKVAEQHSVPLSPSTQKLGNFTITSTKVLADWIGARRQAAHKEGTMPNAFDKLAEAFKGVDPYIVDKDYQVKLAEAIHTLDKESGVDKFYGRSIPDPMRTVWNTEKLAANQVMLNGMPFDINMLASLPADFWADILGPEGVAEVAPGGNVNPTILAQVIETLPQDLKTVLATQLASYNK